MALPNHLVEALVRSKARTELLREMSAKRWLAITYRKSLYGGYQREDGTFTTKPHAAAVRFHEACKDPENYTFFIGGGRRCLGGETPVWDEGRKEWRRIDSITESITVLAWDGAGLVPARAETWEQKGPDPLFRVTLSDSSSFRATAGHRVMRGDGSWASVSSLDCHDELLRGFAHALPVSTWDISQSVRSEGDRHCFRTEPDWQGGCPTSCRSCGERLHRDSDTSQGAFPSPCGVLGHTHQHVSAPHVLRLGVPQPTGRHSHGHQHGDRLATSGALDPTRHQAQLECCGAYTGETHADCYSQVALQSTGSTDPLDATHESFRWATDGVDALSRLGVSCGSRPAFGHSPHWMQSGSGSGPAWSTQQDPSSTSRISSDDPLDTSSSLKVVNVAPDGVDVHYDLCVPGYENFLAGGVIHHNSSKTWTAMSEFCSWIRGERPWDGSKTAPRGTGRRWLMCAPNFSTHFPDVLCPYFEQRMGDMIVDVIKNQQKCPQTYILKTGDTVRCNSYEQYLKAAHDQTTVFQSGSIAGAYFDEHPPREVYLGVRRGLVSGASEYGWGKSIIAATPEHCAWIKDEIYDESWNKGGSERSIWSTEFSIYDNPGNTEESIARMEIGLTEEEKEAILYGRFRHLAGRVYGDFDEHTHVVTEWDPLLKPGSETEPSDWPVICTIDPHDRRPPFISWAAISPQGDFYFVDEWPKRDYERIHRDAGGFPDWKAHIEEVESNFPGGSKRVLYRVMDPKFGGSKKAGNRMTVQQEMRKLGLYFRTDFFEGGESVLLTTGHRAVKTLLSWPHKDEPFSEINRPKLFVHERCRNIIWAFLHYTHGEHMKSDDKAPKETPKEIGKDPMDTVRYAVMARPGWTDWRHRGELQVERNQRLAGRMARAMK